MRQRGWNEVSQEKCRCFWEFVTLFWEEKRRFYSSRCQEQICLSWKSGTRETRHVSVAFQRETVLTDDWPHEARPSPCWMLYNHVFHNVVNLSTRVREQPVTLFTRFSHQTISQSAGIDFNQGGWWDQSFCTKLLCHITPSQLLWNWGCMSWLNSPTLPFTWWLSLSFHCMSWGATCTAAWGNSCTVPTGLQRCKGGRFAKQRGSL